jgi:hypothetical protein
MPPSPCTPWVFAATPAVRERLSSRLLDGFSEWWQAPGLVLLAATVVAFVAWTYRRDAVELPPARRALLMGLRLGALAALAVAWLDLERTTEYEFVSPSRVAVLIDTSASMTLPDAVPAGGAPADAGAAPAETPRADRALAVLEAGGLVDALRQTHDVSLWTFDSATERIATLPRADDTAPVTGPGPAREPDPSGAATADPEAGSSGGDDWRTRLVPQGDETRLGGALARVLDEEPAGLLAGIVVLSDGASNAGLDPRAAAALLAAANVPVHPLGIGAETLPANVRIADLIAPARVFPEDRFTVTAFLQSQGLGGQRVRVELREVAAGEAAVDAARTDGAPLDARDVVLAGDGELVPVRFDVAGLPTPGRRTLVVKVVPPPADRLPGDDRQEADVEVVDRVTRVLLMASGPGREFQFMRNVLDRDRSFTVDTLLATAPTARADDGVLDAFPDTDAALAEYDAIVAFDVDWRRLDAAARDRLERWVGRESGGILLVAGSVSMEPWLADAGLRTIRSLYPVELRGLLPAPGGGTPAETARPVRLTRDGETAEFLRLATDAATSDSLWSSFPGVYACFETAAAKPGATVYARLADDGGPARETQPIYLAGHYYGSGTALYLGSGEVWRLRAIDPRLHERLTTQLVRHVAQGRLLRGSRTSRLLVDRDRVPVGSTAQVRLVLPEGTGARAGAVVCRVRRPDGGVTTVPLDPEPGRPDVRRGGFVVTREGGWQIDADLAAPVPERLSRRIQAHLPDRELARPRLDRDLLADVARLTGGSARFLAADGWTTADALALAAALPDRSRRVYEPGSADVAFKRRLNAALLALGVGLLCAEWLARRLLKLA